MKPKLIKGIALGSFIILLSVFLLYRGGYLSPNPSKRSIKSQPSTTLVSKKAKQNFVSAHMDNVPMVQLPSTKAVILVPYYFVYPDSVIQSKPENMLMMSGSKSAPVFDQNLFRRELWLMQIQSDPTAYKTDSILSVIKREQAEKKKQE